MSARETHNGNDRATTKHTTSSQSWQLQVSLYVMFSERKKAALLWCFRFSHQINVTANDGSFWCLMTEIQKLRSSRQVFFEVSSKFLRSFLRSSSKLPWKNFEASFKVLGSFLWKSSFFKKKLEILFKLLEKSVIFFKDAKFPGFPSSIFSVEFFKVLGQRTSWKKILNI